IWNEVRILLGEEPIRVSENSMYERFTDRARRVMQLANQEAIRLKHEYIGTEHILLGLIKESTGLAGQVLRSINLDLHRLRCEIERMVESEPPDTQDLSNYPRAKKVIEYAIEEARSIGHHYVGTEHLLLGLLRERDGMASRVLSNLGVDLSMIR